MFRATLANRQAVHSCVHPYQPCTAVYSRTNSAQLCTGVPTVHSCLSCTKRAQLRTGVPTVHR